MIWSDYLAERKRKAALKAIEARRKPDLAYWSRSLAQTPTRRTDRLIKAGVYSPELWQVK